MMIFFVNSTRMFPFQSYNLLFINYVAHLQLTNANRYMYIFSLI